MMRNSRLNTIDYNRWQKRPLFRPRRRRGWRTVWVVLALVAVVSAVAATLHENPLVDATPTTDLEAPSGGTR
jgi:fatty acid desaturase